MMAALRRRGLRVAPFKVGPDFIDPGHHAQAAGHTGRNLDGWMLSREYNRECFQRQVLNADVAVIEGAMGLFDGFSGRSEAGSTAQMAKWLDLPVLLVVDAAGLARSAAALVQGFVRFDPQVRFAGVLFNNLGSAGHLRYLRDALAQDVGVPVLGGLLRDARMTVPERHLGLVTADERPLSGDGLQILAQALEEALDLDTLLAALPRIEAPPPHPACVRAATGTPVRIGVARDPAFCFYYPDNLALLAAAGAVLVPFSPLSDRVLPEALDGLYFGGGYPELHAEQLSANRTMRDQVRLCSRQGMPIYAECGGFMYLCGELQQVNGTVHPMCGCFALRTRMHATLSRLGYRRVRLAGDTLLGRGGAELRGHEFHYSALSGDAAATTVDTVFAVEGRKSGGSTPEGYTVYHTLGSYIHLHFGSRPECAAAFVEKCRAFREKKNNTPLPPTFNFQLL